jgi:FtsZ-binding cell division protein ZapB
MGFRIYEGVQMIKSIKKLLQTPTLIELVVRELVEAHRSKLEAQSAQDYARSVVQYNIDRIERLTNTLDELKEQA